MSFKWVQFQIISFLYIRLLYIIIIFYYDKKLLYIIFLLYTRYIIKT